jgi:hypothetical protein
MRHAIEEEEKIPMEYVTNFDEVCADIVERLSMLRDCPNRLENPQSYSCDEWTGRKYYIPLILCRLRYNYKGQNPFCWVF